MWERMLRTFKESLRKTIGTRLMTEEQLRTVAVEIEAMMNDRPLMVPTGALEDAAPITPSLLMSGRSLRSLPTAAPARGGASITALWNARQQILEQGWKHFYKTYVRNVLPRIQKWKDADAALLKVGQVVLLTTENPARGQWPRARVLSINDGPRTRDGLIRTVTVRLADGRTLTRAIQQLVLLELQDEEDDDGEEDSTENA